MYILQTLRTMNLLPSKHQMYKARFIMSDNVSRSYDFTFAFCLSMLENATFLIKNFNFKVIFVNFCTLQGVHFAPKLSL